MKSCWSFCPNGLMLLVFLILQDCDGNQWIYIYLLIFFDHQYFIIAATLQRTNNSSKEFIIPDHQRETGETVPSLGSLQSNKGLSNVWCHFIHFPYCIHLLVTHSTQSLPAPGRPIAWSLVSSPALWHCLSFRSLDINGFTPNISWLASGQPCSHNSSWPAANFLLVRAAACSP